MRRQSQAKTEIYGRVSEGDKRKSDGRTVDRSYAGQRREWKFMVADVLEDTEQRRGEKQQFHSIT